MKGHQLLFVVIIVIVVATSKISFDDKPAFILTQPLRDPDISLQALAGAPSLDAAAEPSAPAKVNKSSWLPAFSCAGVMSFAPLSRYEDCTVAPGGQKVLTITKEAEQELVRRHERLDITSRNVERMVDDQERSAR